MRDIVFSKKLLKGLNSDHRQMPSIKVLDSDGRRLLASVILPEGHYVEKCQREIFNSRMIDKMLEVDVPSLTMINIFNDVYDHFNQLVYNVSNSFNAIINSISTSQEDLELSLQLEERFPIVLSYLSNQLGLLEKEERTDFLKALAASLQNDDRIVIGVDLRKSPQDILAPYLNEKVKLNRHAVNTLRYCNRIINTNFDENKFVSNVNYCPEKGVLSHFLVSTAAQRVSVGDNTRPIMLSKWETIKLIQTKLYSHRELNQELVSCGLLTIDYVTDDNGWFAIYVVAKAHW